MNKRYRMAYVYRHIRIDKNVPFYIGIGSDDNYKRAYAKADRSPFWKNITAKSAYYIEIMLDDLTWEEACKKEIEFISLYKRVKDGGILCNITLGGDGKLGVKPTNAYKKGSIPYTKGKPMPKHVKEAMKKGRDSRPNWSKGINKKPEWIEKQMATKRERGTIYSGDKHPMYGKTHSDELKARWSVIRKGVEPWNKGKKWAKDQMTPKMVGANAGLRKSIEQYTKDGILVNTFISLLHAETITGIGRGCISLCANGKRPTAGGFVWKKKVGQDGLPT